MLGRAGVEASLLCNGIGSDTDCSGGAASWETAGGMIMVAAHKRGLFCDLYPRMVSEKNTAMQHMLLHRIPADCCLQRDILGIYGDAPAAYQYIYEQPDFRSRLSAGQALPIVDYIDCLSHDRPCPLRNGSGSRIIGWPCQDFSVAGNQLMLEGPQTPVAISVGRKAQASPVPLACVECTSKMPLSLPSDCFGPRYVDWAPFYSAPADVNCDFIRRDRHP